MRYASDKSPYLSRSEIAELHWLELFQEAKVGFVEQSNVIHVVLEHRHSLDAEAPRVAIPQGRVDAAVAEHLRVHHAAAADFEPALVPAALAAHAAADAACHVELEARLGERKVARTDAHLALDPVQRLDHEEQRALHISDGQRLVDREAFDLAEVRQARRLERVAAVNAAWRDDVDRRLL